jgi:RNA polymerase sigma factor (sigma-70 family)
MFLTAEMPEQITNCYKTFVMLYETQNDAIHSAFLPSCKPGSLNYIDDKKLSDKLLWNAFKKGDELAFIRIYKNYSTLLFEYGCKYAADKEMVRDCLHDFFLYLKKNRMGFSETTSIKLYLFKAFRRRIIEYLKKNNYEFNLKEPSEYSPWNVESSIEAVYITKQINAEHLERLNKAISALDNKEREAIYYFYFKGLSYEQIAERFNFSHVSSARRVMYRSLKQMRHFFS